MAGCKDCKNKHHLWPKCALHPHERNTSEKIAIVRWLGQPGRQSWVDAGCPSFKENREDSFQKMEEIDAAK